MTPEEMQSAARSLANRRFIEGMEPSDVAQEAILYMLEAQQQGIPPAKWLRYADAKLRNLQKKRPPDAPVFPDGFGEYQEDPLKPDSVLTEVADEEAFNRLLEPLSARERELLTLVFKHDASDEAIAEAMGYSSIHAVQKSKSQAIRKLRRQNEP